MCNEKIDKDNKIFFEIINMNFYYTMNDIFISFDLFYRSNGKHLYDNSSYKFFFVILLVLNVK